MDRKSLDEDVEVLKRGDRKAKIAILQRINAALSDVKIRGSEAPEINLNELSSEMEMNRPLEEVLAEFEEISAACKTALKELEEIGKVKEIENIGETTELELERKESAEQSGDDGNGLTTQSGAELDFT